MVWRILTVSVSPFKGRLVSSRLVGDYEGIVCEITGSAHITGVNVSMVDIRDPMKFGFSLS